MPRRNNHDARHRHYRPADEQTPPEYTTEQLARRLVAEGRCPATILESHQNPISAPAGAQWKGQVDDR